jgi:hypothetical protein
MLHLEEGTCVVQVFLHETMTQQSSGNSNLIPMRCQEDDTIRVLRVARTSLGRCDHKQRTAFRKLASTVLF